MCALVWMAVLTVRAMEGQVSPSVKEEDSGAESMMFGDWCDSSSCELSKVICRFFFFFVVKVDEDM